MSQTITQIMKPKARRSESPDFEPTPADYARFRQAVRALKNGRLYLVSFGCDRDGNLRAKEETHFTPIT